MKAHRHPHPHIDPRQPRDCTRPGTNPPVFAWKPPEDHDACFTLLIAHDPDFRNHALELRTLREPLYLPKTAFEIGTYYWKWSDGTADSDVWSFEITSDAAKVEVPGALDWLDTIGRNHPRIFLTPETTPEFREAMGNHPDEMKTLCDIADKVIAESHTIDEPPFLPDPKADYETWFDIWRGIMVDSRTFCIGAEMMALAHLATGDRRYARAACERMASMSLWDPDGSSTIEHNDEAHMSIIWHGPTTCDWVWDEFTDEEREVVIRHFTKRGRNTFEHCHDHGMYGITRFDSHAGREIVFLAMTALVFHEHIPEASDWLEWLRPVLCGIWPIWSGDDGGWAEGPSYGQAYVEIMTQFASALKHGTGVNLYHRPFWAGHMQWKQYCWPTYAEWIGFGDHTERSVRNWSRNLSLIELISHESGDQSFMEYVREVREARDGMEQAVPPINPAAFIVSAMDSDSMTNVESPANTVMESFPYAGWAAFRTDLDDPAKDVALVFRSSPLGSYSHAHANHNDFFMHVAGKAMLTPSGYYDGYGSNHHTHWVWHTKSHNCVTLSDSSQLMRSHDALGKLVGQYEDDNIAYIAGHADSCYAHMAERYRRHVVYLKNQVTFLLLDEFQGKPGVNAAFQWNVHSWAPFKTDADARTFRAERDGSAVTGHLLFHQTGFFSVTEGWDPPPMRKNPQWMNQYHLRFTPNGLHGRRVFGVVLCPEADQITPPSVTTCREDDVEIASIGGSNIRVYEDGDVLAKIETSGTRYEMTESGIQRV